MSDRLYLVPVAFTKYKLAGKINKKNNIKNNSKKQYKYKCNRSFKIKNQEVQDLFKMILV